MIYEGCCLSGASRIIINISLLLFYFSIIILINQNTMVFHFSFKSFFITSCQTSTLIKYNLRSLCKTKLLCNYRRRLHRHHYCKPQYWYSAASKCLIDEPSHMVAITTHQPSSFFYVSHIAVLIRFQQW